MKENNIQAEAILSFIEGVIAFATYLGMAFVSFNPLISFLYVSGCTLETLRGVTRLVSKPKLIEELDLIGLILLSGIILLIFIYIFATKNGFLEGLIIGLSGYVPFRKIMPMVVTIHRIRKGVLE